MGIANVMRPETYGYKEQNYFNFREYTGSVVEDEFEEDELEKDGVFKYGYRMVDKFVNGKRETVYEPLTLDDYLNPRLGDKFMQGTNHTQMLPILASMLKGLVSKRKYIMLSDVQLSYKGKPEPAPDIMIIPKDITLEKNKGSWKVGTKDDIPICIFEVVSDDFRKKDYEKKGIYEKKDIDEYFILDHTEKDDLWYYFWRGYHRVKNKYEEIKPDDGWLYCKALGIRLNVTDDKRDIVLKDAITNKLILPETERANQAELLAAKEAEARKAAEAKAGKEAEARKAAEAKAGKEADKAIKEAEARKAAEEKLYATEQLLKEMEEKMAALNAMK